jgi:hypothetical protein
MKRWVAGSIAGAAIGASLLQSMARRAQVRSIAAFYRSGGPPQRVVVDGRELWLPIVIHRMDGFGSLHAASLAAARELLPSDALRPVRLPGDRAMVLITAFRYYEMTDSRPAPVEPAEPPYAEVTITILATRGGRSPLLSLALMGTGLMPTAGYVPHMAVTHRLARDGGRELWGVPKFIADIDFIDDVARREVRLAEGEQHILTLSVRPAGRLRTSTQPSVMYTVLDGSLVETRMPGIFEVRTAFGPGRGRLELGPGGHPVTETLRRLDVTPNPLGVLDSPVIRTMFVPGVAVGAGRRVVDYEGSDRAVARFTVCHPGTGPIDQNAALPLRAIWAAPDSAERPAAEARERALTT